MYILTEENKSLDTALIPAMSDKLHYCIYDFSDPDYLDYRFPAMAWVEEYAKAAMEIMIGPYTIQVPSSWAILLGDVDNEALELLPVFEFHGRDFSAFTFNPCTGYMVKFLPIEESNIYKEIKWSVPTIHPTHMLAIPLCGGENPLCAFFAETKNKIPDLIDLSEMI